MTPEEIVRLLSETLDLDLVTRRIVDGVRTLLQVDAAVIYRRDANTDDMVATAVSGDVGPAFGSAIVFPRGSGVVGAALRERRPIFSANLLSDERITLTRSFERTSSKRRIAPCCACRSSRRSR